MSKRSSCVSTTTAVSASGRRRSRASPGHATSSSPALGRRSFVANPGRASTTAVRQPSRVAARQSASAVSTAPKTSRRGGGPSTSAKTVSPSSSSTRLGPASIASRAVRRRSPARSPSITVRDTPGSSGSGSPLSSRSTKTSISPPQGSPTSQASSSAIPYERSRGAPPAITSRACSATSLSTHPPETEPNSFPFSETASFDPTGRGAERSLAETEPLHEHAGPIELAGVDQAASRLVGKADRLEQLGRLAQAARVAARQALGLGPPRIRKRKRGDVAELLDQSLDLVRREESRCFREERETVTSGRRGKRDLDRFLDRLARRGEVPARPLELCLVRKHLCQELRAA